MGVGVGVGREGLENIKLILWAVAVHFKLLAFYLVGARSIIRLVLDAGMEHDVSILRGRLFPLISAPSRFRVRKRWCQFIQSCNADTRSTFSGRGARLKNCHARLHLSNYQFVLV